jgi:hypothetical protein
VVDTIPFEGECYFHPILHYVTWLSSTFSSTSNSDSLINHSSIHLIYYNRARLNLRVQHFNGAWDKEVRIDDIIVVGRGAFKAATSYFYI